MNQEQFTVQLALPEYIEAALAKHFEDFVDLFKGTSIVLNGVVLEFYSVSLDSLAMEDSMNQKATVHVMYFPEGPEGTDEYSWELNLDFNEYSSYHDTFKSIESAAQDSVALGEVLSSLGTLRVYHS